MSSWLKKIFGGKEGGQHRPRVEAETTHRRPPAKLPPRRDEKQSATDQSDIYLGLRQRALSSSRTELGIAAPPLDSPAWGLLMETGLSHGTATVLSMSDGSASIYMSNGGGIIGGQGHEAVSKAAMAFVQMAGSLHAHFKPTDKFHIPKTGKTIFYIFTDNGIVTAEAGEDDLGNGRHLLSPLFHAGHVVITEMRLISEPSHRLAHAVINDDSVMLKKLLLEGLDSNAKDPVGVPVLAIATSRKQLEIVRLLLDAGANPNVLVTNRDMGLNLAPVINMSAANGGASILRLLIAAKADIEAKDATGLSPLMCAAYTGKPDTLETLIEAGCAIESRDNSGYTALMFACNAGHVSCVKSLLACRADANARDNDNSTPVMFAAQHGYDESVRLLLSAGADPKFRGKHGLSAIAFAKQNGRQQTEKILLGLG